MITDTEPAPCRRTNAHTPHDTPDGHCPGTAPEFPWERVEDVNTRDFSLQQLHEGITGMHWDNLGHGGEA